MVAEKKCAVAEKNVAVVEFIETTVDLEISIQYLSLLKGVPEVLVRKSKTSSAINIISLLKRNCFT